MKFLKVHFCLILLCLNINAQTGNISYVNPFIGTGGHGHTFPGAVLPFGMVQLSPDTRVDGSWDGCSGYHYDDKIIYGFSHTHLSGTGCSDWGDILVMPMSGKASIDNKVYSSSFDHKNEKALPGYYEVLLDKGAIKVELTATQRVGVHRYTFPSSTTEAHIILDLMHRDKTIDCYYKVKDSVTITGFRVSEAWAKTQQVYFAIKFSKPFTSQAAANSKKFISKYVDETMRREGASFNFDVKDGNPILLKVAISPVDEEGALKNLEQEAKHWNFENYKSAAEKTWEEQLNKISIEETNKDKRTVFYTALYHCFIHPSLNMDVDGQYRGRDNRIYVAKGFVNYSVFSLWDTYRALHPLFTIIERQRSNDFINSFLAQYKQSGRLPMWELSSNETDCMIGFHAVSVIADAFVKGIDGFDTLAAYEAMKAASVYTAFGIPAFNRRGYLRVDDESESVSKTLEYAYDNWCIAQMAKKLGKTADEKFYLGRTLAYRNLFDVNTGHMRPRKNGNWLSPFFPEEINNHFTEGNSWQYSFYVPHDIQGLISLYGTEDNFEKKLDELFTTSSKTKGREQADVTGLIGQYAHGNEPSHHMAYLYNYVGKPQKSVQYVKKICNDFYKNAPDGLIGNEDCGQMSAWYIFSTMGFYPVCPGSTQYVLGESEFNEVVIQLENKKTFKINAKPQLHKQVKGIILNGKYVFRSYIDHSEISSGSLQFDYDEKGIQYAVKEEDRPNSHVKSIVLIAAPLIKSSGQVFKDKLKIEIESINDPAREMRYTTNGAPLDKDAKVYTGPFEIDTNCVVKAKVITEGNLRSLETDARFYKIKYNYGLTIESKPNDQYKADGVQTLIDGIRGDWDWRKGGWLGYQGQDLKIVIDLKNTKEIGYLSLGCLQETGSWIVYPKEVAFYGSMDNINFTLLQTAVNPVDVKEMNVQARNFTVELKQKTKVRYVKMVARNFGTLPEWHQGAGGASFIFVDELEIR